MQRTIGDVLRAAPIDAVDARALLKHVLQVDDAYLIAYAQALLSEAQSARLSELIVRRRAGEPIAYIIGHREFFSLDFKVTPAVLIPRPETELLVEFALQHISPEAPARVLDLGTGSGCVAVSIAKERPLAQVIGVDSSRNALVVAKENARYHAVSNMEFLTSAWFENVTGCFDVVVANPPYVSAADAHLLEGDVRFEPRIALVGGADGLDCIRDIVAAAPDYLRNGGWLALEHGYDQAQNCRELMKTGGFADIRSHMDLAGVERITVGVKPTLV